MIVKEAGLSGITPHKLRHHFATVLINQGISLETISELLGHDEIAITQKYYAHLSDEKKRAAVAVLDFGEM